jgi:hypothetical protein
MDLNKIAIDTKSASEGTWIDIGDGASLLIARWDNPAFSKMLRKRVRKGARLGGDSSDTDSDKEMADLLAQTVLLGWKGLTAAGEPLPYSKEAAFNLLSDPSLVEFRDLVVRLSQDAANFRKDTVEGLQGN